MIAFRFYKTHGYDGWFVRNGRNKWQPVKRFLCFYVPWGRQIREQECNYF